MPLDMRLYTCKQEVWTQTLRAPQPGEQKTVNNPNTQKKETMMESYNGLLYRSKKQ